MSEIKLSTFVNVYEITKPVNRDIQEIFGMIRNPEKNLFGILKRIRNEKDKAKRNAIKNNLPVYTFSGTFRERNNAGIENYSGIIVVDFDGIENPKELKDKVCQDSNTYAAFLSPSGRGVKVLVQTNNRDPKLHTRFVEAIQEYYNKYAPIDPQGSGLCMGAYASYDPDLYIDPCADEWVTPKEEVTSYYCGWKDAGLDDPGFAMFLTNQEELYIKAVEFVQRYEVFAEGSRDRFVFRLANQCNKLGISDSSLPQRIACDFGNTKGFGMSEIQKCVRSAYKKTTDFNTIKLKDYTRYKMIRDLKKTNTPVNKIITMVRAPRIQGESPVKEDVINAAIEEIANENPGVYMTFWDTFQKDPDKPESPFIINISRYKFIKWLEKLGVRVFYPLPDRTGDFTFIRLRNNVVKIVESTFIQNQARQLIETLPPVVDFVSRDMIMEKFLGDIDSVTSAKKLAVIQIQDISFHRDTRDESFFYFRNGIIRITRDNIDLLGYEQLDKFVWDTKIRKSIITPPSEGELPSLDDYLLMGKGVFDFGDWLYKTAGEDLTAAKAICAALGYLCHNYSDPSNPKAVVLLETPINGKAEGGTGKGILTQAVEQMRTVIKENGKLLDLSDKFWLQGLKSDTDVFCLDDINPKKFDFENLFSVLSEGIPVERKHQNKIYISPQESPKFIMTTNYPFKDTGFSGDRRRYEVELTHNFKINYGTPFEYYKKLFFKSDWTPAEWQTFYYFMFECVRYYMSLDGKLESVPSTPLAIRKLIADTSNSWVEFATTYIDFNVWYSKGMIKEKYGHKYHITPTTQTITSFIKSYAKFLNCTIEEATKNETRSIMIKTLTENSENIEVKPRLSELKMEMGTPQHFEDLKSLGMPHVDLGF